MNLLLHHNKTPPPPCLYSLRHLQFLKHETKFSLKPCLHRSPISHHNSISRIHGPLRFEAPAYTTGKDETFITSMEIGGGREEEDLSSDGAVYRKTLRLVECSMFAALAGLVYFLSNSLSIENYFGCFFPLPIVISSMRWGIAAGRKTMVATAMLLLVLSGPLKALTYLLTHGLLGLAIGSLWRLGASWSISIPLCTLVRAVGALGYVSITSFLIKENILALITVNLHASVSLILTASGINSLPSMNLIYTIFGIVLLLNSILLVFLLHLLYSVFFARLGMRDSLRLPKWLDKAI